MRSARVVQELLESEPVISRRRHPELATTMDRMIRDGRLATVLPGVYAPPDRAGDLRTRLAAIPEWHPDAVVLGRAAAQQTFWPKLRVREIEVAARGRGTSARGFVVRQRTIKPEHILERGSLRLTVPPLTALDLTDELDGDPLDCLLLSRQSSLAELHTVLADTPQRAGNKARRQLLVDSRDEPWSHPERVAHRLLRAAGVTGWRTNLEVTMLGTRYFIDIAFERQRVAVEIDGYQYHGPKPSSTTTAGRTTSSSPAGTSCVSPPSSCSSTARSSWRRSSVRWRSGDDDAENRRGP